MSVRRRNFYFFSLFAMSRSTLWQLIVALKYAHLGRREYICIAISSVVVALVLTISLLVAYSFRTVPIDQWGTFGDEEAKPGGRYFIGLGNSFDLWPRYLLSSPVENITFQAADDTTVDLSLLILFRYNPENLPNAKEFHDVEPEVLFRGANEAIADTLKTLTTDYILQSRSQTKQLMKSTL